MLVSRRLITRAALVSALSVVFAGVGGGAALANHRAPFDGTMHAYGEMVEYDLNFPVSGPVSFGDTFYSARGSGYHHATDLMSQKMVPVVAAAAGTVRYVNYSRDPGQPNPERCCTLVLDHDDDWSTWYIHLNNDTPGTDDGQGWGIAPGIEPGVHVDAGDLIGWVGDSGNAENVSPHLHFELYDPEGVIVNAYAALEAAQANCTVDCYPFITLAYGSRGGGVLSLQTALTNAGFSPGPRDGIFGYQTRSAVVAFQTTVALTPTGVVDKPTWDAVKAWVAEPAPVDPIDEPNLTPVIAPGGHAESVVELQVRLLSLGHDPGPIDGIFGKRTLSAAKSFQTAAGLPVNGVVDQATWDALLGSSSVGDVSDLSGDDEILEYWARGAAVAELQTLLAGAGYNPGHIDGVFGPNTRAAISSFQRATGLPETGILTRATWEGLSD